MINAVTASERTRIKCQKGLIVWMVHPLIQQCINIIMTIITIRIAVVLTLVNKMSEIPARWYWVIHHVVGLIFVSL